MKVGFIGAGKVGTSFGLFLNKKGINLSGFSSRKYSSSERSAYLTNSKAYEDKIDLVKESDIIFITTNDDSIKKVADEISSSELILNKKVICHMSGALDSTIFTELKEKGATTASLHPMYPFSNIEQSAKQLQNANFSLEGDGEYFESIRKLLEKTSITYQEIETNKKILYHTAACIASNYLVSLLNTSIDMLKSVGFEEKKALSMLKTLVSQTINDIFEFGPQDALTGPISRGDIDTVCRHLEKLKETDNEEWLKLYQILGLSTLNIAKNKGEINENILKKLEKELNENEKSNYYCIKKNEERE